jgi:solute carrier family 13 (sodium-dependent dicarboxylate transporter), member 2/3/5
MGARQRTGLVLGPALFALVLLLPRAGGMDPAMQRVAAIALLMASWWICETVPLAATALLPVILFPALGVMKPQAATAPYANHLIFLFLGGFLIAVTMERWELHRRIAVKTIRIVGRGPARIILGFMIASAVLSMWISNTATVMMMVPIGLAVIRHVESSGGGDGGSDGNRERMIGRFSPALMLGIAYAASIGGAATLIGTPPNVILAGYVERTWGFQVSFASWMAFGVPLAAVMLAIAWLVLTRIAFRLGGADFDAGMTCLEEEARSLGPLLPQEKRVLVVFVIVAAAWIGRGFIGPVKDRIADSTIAVAGALALFLIPSGRRRGERLLDWSTASRIPWDVIILFGGGLSLAGGFAMTGLDLWIGERLTVLGGADQTVLIAAVVLLSFFLTEVTSNTATAAMLLPVIAGLALSMSMHPFGLLIGSCIASSYAFMLPVATPPNAVVFGSRRVTMLQMIRAGAMLNLVGWIMIVITVTRLLPLVWGIDLGSVPPWATGG